MNYFSQNTPIGQLLNRLAHDVANADPPLENRRVFIQNALKPHWDACPDPDAARAILWIDDPQSQSRHPAPAASLYYDGRRHDYQWHHYHVAFAAELAHWEDLTHLTPIPRFFGALHNAIINRDLKDIHRTAPDDCMTEAVRNLVDAVHHASLLITHRQRPTDQLNKPDTRHHAPWPDHYRKAVDRANQSIKRRTTSNNA